MELITFLNNPGCIVWLFEFFSFSVFRFLGFRVFQFLVFWFSSFSVFPLSSFIYRVLIGLGPVHVAACVEDYNTV